MIVRSLKDIIGTDREVHAPTWSSRRLSLADDGMGFSMHDTVLHVGTETKMWYQHHLEAVYCVEGHGTLEDLATGEIHDIEEGTIYLLNENDRHILRAKTQFRMVCVFNPPLVGPETHDENGTYPLLTSDGSEATVGD